MADMQGMHAGASNPPLTIDVRMVMGGPPGRAGRPGPQGTEEDADGGSI